MLLLLLLLRYLFVSLFLPLLLLLLKKKGLACLLTCDLATVEAVSPGSGPPDPALVLAMAARLCSANFWRFW